MISKRPEPCSYVLNEKGNIIRRNRWQLLPTNETINEVEMNTYDEIRLPITHERDREAFFIRSRLQHIFRLCVNYRPDYYF